MGSNWNTVMDGLCRVGLGEHEQRVLAAVVRLTLGYYKTSDKIAISTIVDKTGLDRRHVSRALADLHQRGIIVRAGGSRGRGNTATITVVLDHSQWQEKSPHGATNKSRLTARHSDAVKVASPDTKKSPQEAHSKGRGVKIPAQSAAHDLRRDAFDAYLSTGGSLTLERERGALAHAVTSALNAGTDRDVVLAACRELGRENAFPGLLKQRIAAIVDRGGVCDHEGLDRSQMTVTQLRACGCGRCTEWAEAHEATRERQPA